MDLGAATKFGQKLAHTDKHVRDKAVKNLTMYLVAKKEWSDLDLDKIWKALFYCMWMSDKMKIQMELADNLSKLVHAFPADDLKLRFVHSFLKTMQREWHGIDGLRLDKFYSLMRMTLFQSFKFLEAADWALCQEFATNLSTAVLSKMPNGLRLHVCDIYLAELFKAVGDVVPTTAVVQLLEPFFTLMSSDADKTVTKRVNDLVFQPLLAEYFFADTPAPTTDAATDAETDEEEAAPKVFAAATLAHVQHRVFDVAAAEGTLERNRNLLYNIYTAMYAKTKVDSTKKREEPKAPAPKRTAKAAAKKAEAAVTEASKESPKTSKAAKKAAKAAAKAAATVVDEPVKAVEKEIPAKAAKAAKEPAKVTKEVVKAPEEPAKAAKKAKKTVEEPAKAPAAPVKAAAKAAAEPKAAKKAKETAKTAKATPYPRCAVCGGFGKSLVAAGKTMCGHCERTSKASKKEAKKTLKRKVPAEVEAEEEDTKRVTFGKTKALPYELSMKRMKKSATKEVVKPATGKGVLKVKEIKAKHDMTSSATLTKSMRMAARAGARQMSSHATEAEALQQMNLWTNVSKGMIAGMAGLTVITAISHAGGHEHHDEGEHVVYAHNKIRTKPYPWKYSDCNFFDLDCKAKAKAAEQALN
ncbi:ribosomal RNA processing protein 1 [Achlya hypogyna]|uniref:Ribosomal RNA processing protein 1 n=1 Tax=Achlya hypogyna TaxID=1202772 RepID=A0A1V9YQZ5_ACHHY|nr:ribosomal RNA processing protein 1 [Achlya hypogyna]